MKKLNNEELQNVSGGTGSDVPADIPTLEDAKALLLEHGGKCKYCGQPVQEFVPLEIVGHDGDYFYYFNCSEIGEVAAVRYYKGVFEVMYSIVPE